MSLFEDLINSKIRELEELKQNLLVDIESKIRKEADAALNKFSAQITNVESEVTLERERILYDAVVESRRKIAETYEQLLKDLIDAVYNEIDKMRGSESYIKFLTSLIENAIGYVQTKDLVIYTSPKDKGVVEAIARSLGITGIVTEKEMRGGVIVAAKDGSVSVDYSLETLIANKLDDLKHLLYSETV
jgi:Archaeal/vacuolar-type H+-ATPase subunit E